MEIALFGILFALGLFLILADVLNLPRIETQKAMVYAGKANRDKPKTIDTLLLGWQIKLSHILTLDDYKRQRLANTVTAAGLNTTPEMFTAGALLKAGLIAVAALPALLFFPIAAPVLIIAAILVFMKEIKKADGLLTEKRGKIEQELPRFVATITQELKASRDVLSILEHYKRSAGGSFAEELGVLTADMRSSSYEAALTRFEARINSPMLSDITRGLIGVLRGDDGTVYFQMLAHDMKQLELQSLRARAAKVPKKINKFSHAMLACFMATYMYVLMVQIVQSLTEMF